MLENLFEGPHLIIILLAIVVLFGAKRIPEIMGGLGKGIKEFKKAMNDVKEDIKAPEDKPRDISKE
jgi:sec-independent protein translocase protein TatA